MTPAGALPTHTVPTHSVPTHADVVVVGAGSAGSVVAARLARGGRSVVLCEQGADLAPTAAGVMDLGPSSRVVEWVDARLGGAALALPRGSTTGGSGAINGGYCRAVGAEELLAEEARLGGHAWTADRADRYARGLDRARRVLAPKTPPADPLAERVSDAFPGLAVPVPQARRAGRRRTAFDAWDPVGAGVALLRGAGVAGLRWRGGRPGTACTGVVLTDGREIAAREVALCAGTVGSARLLRGSGIGPETSGHPVGTALEEHPEVLIDLPGPPASGVDGPEVPRPPLLSRVIPLRLSSGALVEIRPYSGPISLAVPGAAPEPHRLGVALMTPRGRGALVPADPGAGGDRAAPGDQPARLVVDLDAHPDPGDAAALAEATALVRERLGLDGAETPSTSQHLSGSARIREVVDDHGRVLGVEGLRVSDASVLPRLVPCGPYLAVLAMAEVLAGG